MKPKRKPPKPKRTKNAPDIDEAALAAFEKRIAAGKKLTSAELKVYKELEKKSVPEVIGSVKEAAKYSGTTARVIRWANSHGKLRANPDGTFSKGEIDLWMSTRDGREKPVEDAVVSAQEKKGKAQYWGAKGELQVLILKQERGELVTWSEIEKEWCTRLVELKSSLDNLADRVSGLVVGKSRDEIREIIRSEVWTLQDSYHRTGKYTPEVKQ